MEPLNEDVITEVLQFLPFRLIGLYVCGLAISHYFVD
jgi:hypothetical protein